MQNTAIKSVVTGLLVYVGCASSLGPQQRHEVLEALDSAVRERFFDPSRVPAAWLTPARQLADDSEPSWEHDRRMVAAIDRCMRSLASHTHVHTPPQAEQGGPRIPWVTTGDGVSVLYAVECNGGARIVPGELVLGADDAATMRRSVVGPIDVLATLTIRGLDGKERTITWKRSSAAPSREVTSRTLPSGSRYVKIDSFSGFGPFDLGNILAIKRHLRAAVDARGLFLIYAATPAADSPRRKRHPCFSRATERSPRFCAAIEPPAKEPTRWPASVASDRRGRCGRGLRSLEYSRSWMSYGAMNRSPWI